MRPLLTVLSVLFLACGPAAKQVGPPVPVPDFSLKDVNPASPRAHEQVSPRDYEGKVSAWYFGHST